jgi:hypothetical protein
VDTKDEYYFSGDFTWPKCLLIMIALALVGVGYIAIVNIFHPGLWQFLSWG